MNTPSVVSSVSRRTFLAQLSSAGVVALGSRSLFAAAAPSKKLGVALVGLGGYSTGQLGPALRQTQFCRLAGVVTGSPEKGRRWAREYGFPETSIYRYDTMDRLADNPDIDIVYVVTPNSLHARDTIAAAKAGKHVICEKPMAVSVAECDAMLAACAAAKVRLSIGYRLHFDPYHREMMRLAQPSELGPFTKMNGAFSFTMNERPWRAIREFSGGGPLMDIGIYVLQEACMAVGDVAPIAVTAHELPKKRPDIFQDVEETIVWQMEFPGGATCDCRASYQENEDRFRAESAKGWFEFTTAYIYDGLEASSSRGPLSFRNPEVNQQALQMDGFARAVLDRQPSIVPGEMGRRDMAIVEAIYASAASGGKRVAVKA